MEFAMDRITQPSHFCPFFFVIGTHFIAHFNLTAIKTFVFYSVFQFRLYIIAVGRIVGSGMCYFVIGSSKVIHAFLIFDCQVI